MNAGLLGLLLVGLFKKLAPALEGTFLWVILTDTYIPSCNPLVLTLDAKHPPAGSLDLAFLRKENLQGLRVGKEQWLPKQRQLRMHL